MQPTPHPTSKKHDHFWTFRLPIELSEKVTADATRQGVSISAYIRTALHAQTGAGTR